MWVADCDVQHADDSPPIGPIQALLDSVSRTPISPDFRICTICVLLFYTGDSSGNYLYKGLAGVNGPDSITVKLLKVF